MFMSYADIMQEFKKPLHYKIDRAVEAIRQGFAVSRHKQALAFSGGKDSTVLWHIIRSNFPREAAEMEIIYGNTGIEYPESLRFARQLGSEWAAPGHFHETRPQKTAEDGLKYAAQREVLEWLSESGRLAEVLKIDGKLKSTRTLERKATPEMWEDFRRRGLVWWKGTPMSYWWCVDQYGYPILGKAASLLNARRINIDCFLTYSKSNSDRDELIEYYDVLSQCKFSQHCCKLLKKEPSEKLQAELDVDVIFKGLMASESQTRKTNFSTRGYLFASHRDHLGTDPFYHCNPLSIWTDADIWEYSEQYSCPQSELYKMGYTDNKGVWHGIQRNGCWGCATGILYNDNQLKMLRHTHPRLWQALMNHGMANELKKLYHTRSRGIPTIIDVIDDPETLIERRPCAFDDMENLIDSSGIDDIYDSEA